jgi:2-dehydro-3-deoxygalactonokinase
MNEISNIPFVFIRGVKDISEDYVDMMRGEETEIYGISELPEKNSMYIMPGSHSKLIHIDGDNRISHFSTALTGEMISAIACNTILKSVIDLNQSAKDTAYLQKGYLFSKEHGISEALFKVRSLKMFLNCNDTEIFSFYIGAILAPEIDSIIKSSATTVFVGGKTELKVPIAELLRLNSTKNIEIISAEIADNATAYGCVRIYEKSLEN